MAQPTPDGLSQRDHLLAYARASGQMPPELAIPPLPGALALLWGVFLQLHDMRGGGMGPSPINAQDLLAYQQLHGLELNPWELDCLHALDKVALNSASQKKPGST